MFSPGRDLVEDGVEIVLAEREQHVGGESPQLSHHWVIPIRHVWENTAEMLSNHDTEERGFT